MTYGLVMIVKNERDTIARCLESVRPLIDYWTVVDTGSDDGTQSIIREALDGIPGQLLDIPFTDFGTTRSAAFAVARGTADWLLASDADMVWTIDPDFEPDPIYAKYLIEMGNHAGFSYQLPLVLRGDLPWKSVGAVHEYTALVDDLGHVSAPTDAIRIDMGPEDRSSPEKSRWHAALLEAELEREPNNPRTVFYLAQTYRELDDPRALELYRRRALMVGFDEEAFYAAFRAALLEPLWPTRQAALLAAWEMRPHRLEPLHALIEELNQRGQHRAAYRLSGPVGPCGDQLFVHRSVWDWGMDFERSIAAWYVGERYEARALGEALLARDIPDHVRTAVLRNLSFVRAA